MSELMPCKKHNVLPFLKEIQIDPWQNTSSPFNTKRYEYVCAVCEVEKESKRRQHFINEWNEKQEKL